jgi:hypothetical protein
MNGSESLNQRRLLNTLQNVSKNGTLPNIILKHGKELTRQGVHCRDNHITRMLSVTLTWYSYSN